MRIRFPDLKQHLGKGRLAPIYLVSGDEPLQTGEAADAIREGAKASGYSSRDVIDADRNFNWDELAAEASNLSLFAEQRVLDLRIPSGKPGAAGGKALVEYTERPADDTLLLITMPKLDRSQTNSKWFKTIDKSGVVIQVWPLTEAQLAPWIEQRMRGCGLSPEPGVTALLAERIEGNLLAAAQEIDKLLLLQGPGPISTEQLLEAVTDSARYDVFDLVDSALSGNRSRSLRILNGLRGEGTPPPVVLWALAREVRTLSELAFLVEKGRSPQQAVGTRRDIWDKRKPLVTKALQRLSARNWRRLLLLCGLADRTIKGREKGDPWLLFQDIATRMAGIPVIK
jgi:DNA polymerase-3 subunit delta